MLRADRAPRSPTIGASRGAVGAPGVEAHDAVRDELRAALRPWLREARSLTVAASDRIAVLMPLAQADHARTRLERWAADHHGLDDRDHRSVAAVQLLRPRGVATTQIRSRTVPVAIAPPAHIEISAVDGVAALELVQRGGDQAGAGGADRVAEGDRAAVDVDLVQVDAGAARPRTARRTRTPR